MVRDRRCHRWPVACLGMRVGWWLLFLVAVACGGDSTGVETPAEWGEEPVWAVPTSSTAVASGENRLVSESPTEELVASLRVEEERWEGYDRGLFSHWSDLDGDGCDTRREVLIRDSAPDYLVMAADRPCWVVSGRWGSPYDGLVLTDAAHVDIDHLVPLAEAWRSGAWRWDSGRRELFANDERSLLAVSAVSNRTKGADDPSEWLPPVEEAICPYAVAWVEAKVRWDLSVDASELATLKQLFGGPCTGWLVALP